MGYLLVADNILPQISQTVDILCAKSTMSECDQLFVDWAARLLDTYNTIVEGVDRGAYNALAKIPCHGDFAPRNMLGRDGEIVGFIDLGGITIDPRVCDVENCG